ncbi:MAG: hypothetical protein ACXWR0_18080 [Bdellovibrio sp.]
MTFVSGRSSVLLAVCYDTILEVHSAKLLVSVVNYTKRDSIGSG